MKKFFVIMMASSLLMGCGTLQNIVNTGPEKQSAAALSAALDAINSKVPQYVGQIFADSMTNEQIVGNILRELKDPLKGYSAQLFDEWVNYSNLNSGKKNSEYKSYQMKLSSAKGDLSKQISEAINQKLPGYFTVEKKAFKTCRTTGSAGACKVAFVDGIEKSISKTIEDKVRKYLKERLDKL